MLNTLNALNQLSGDFFTRATCFRYVDMTQAELASLNGIMAADAEHARWYVERSDRSDL
ncbi:MAG: hypothetical protein ACREM1_10995 [Longimicrobiales bacterium]